MLMKRERSISFALNTPLQRQFKCEIWQMTDDSNQHFPEAKIVPKAPSIIAHFYCYALKNIM